MADLIDDYHLEDEYEHDCPNCGGEGETFLCIDGFCLAAEDGCELCSRPCDWCGGEG